MCGTYAWSWELKSVNAKGLELRLRLPPGWDAVVGRDIDGEGAEATDVDDAEPRFGAFQAARAILAEMEARQREMLLKRDRLQHTLRTFTTVTVQGAV